MNIGPQRIQLNGPGCFLAKTDIGSAFRLIPIYSNDYELFGDVLEREVLL